MRFGIYTPTHGTPHLARAAASVARAIDALAQFDATIDVQWFVAPNGPNGPRGVELEALSACGPFAEIRPSNERGNVGALKAHCCDAALQQQDPTQTYLVELDHDDELTTDCLVELAKEFRAGAGFVSSDTASRTRFSESYGWHADSEVVEGQRLWINRTPLICARSLFEIFYAPNHVRAWSGDAYKRAGGYDRSMAVADDHDLMCRTYSAGVEMRQLPLALYIQHESEQQTQVTRNQEIQVAQAQVGKRHLYALAEREASRRGLELLDLGGAHGCPPGYTPIDRKASGGHVDVTDGLPYATNSVGVVRAHDFLEHIPAARVVSLLNEIYRVLAPGGWLLTSTPSTDGRGAFQDPTHVSFWNSNSWWYWTRAEHAAFVPEITARFQLARIENHCQGEFNKLHQIVHCDAALWALKGQPRIGLETI